MQRISHPAAPAAAQERGLFWALVIVGLSNAGTVAAKAIRRFRRFVVFKASPPFLRVRDCITACILVAFFPAFAVDPPQISDALRARFWRAQAEVVAAQARADKALAAFQAIQAELAKVCGERQLMADPAGEPVCAAKPVEKPKDTK